MKNLTVTVIAGVFGLAGLLGSEHVSAAGQVMARLGGFQEAPAISTTGSGEFVARIESETISYTLSYQALEGNVLQAHIHIGQKGVNGGISAFLCTNLGNGPAGTQLCPTPPATISGTITAADVVGPDGQGIAAEEIGELLDAIDAGVTYVNVHSDVHPGGEIRGQVGRGFGGN